MASPSLLESLPNEMLASILSTLPTPSLLPLVSINRRFYAVTVCILHQRLKLAASLPERRLILECFHPSAKITTPYLFCDYLYTDELEGANGEYSFPEHQPSGLTGLYTHFRPVEQDENRRPRLRHPRRSQAQAQAQAQAEQGNGQSSQEPAKDPPTQDVSFDDSELLTQLCTNINLVKPSARPGLFLSNVNVSDGVIRVWRDWLAAQASGNSEARARAGEPILWADPRHDVGLRFRVTEREVETARRPVLTGADEDLAVSYRLEFSELVVRSHRLLLMMEKSDVQETNTSGKAIVLAM